MTNPDSHTGDTRTADHRAVASQAGASQADSRSTPDFQELAERYIAVWNESDPRRRRQAVDALWTPDGSYVDPLGVAEGAEAIDATIAGAQAQFAGLEFRLAGPVDGHHNQARFTWELGPAGGEAVVVGFDVAVTDRAGRLRQVLGFLDHVPAAADAG